MHIEERFQFGRKLSEFSTFKMGGAIRYYLEAFSKEEIAQGIQYALAHGISYFILGRGSNCFFHDQGFNGLVIHNKINFCIWDNSFVHVSAGYSFSRLGMISAKKGLSGLEFASGIPASVGGAVFMNAGANGCEIKDSLRQVQYLYESGEIIWFCKEDLFFDYRKSSFQQMKGCILSAKFCLIPNPDAQKKQLSLMERRLNTQPYKDKSAGSVFRNPSLKVSAGYLIELCGLKGISIGGAKVSEKHANFIINQGKAKQSDVQELIELIWQTVKEKTGVELQTEIIMVSKG